MQFYKSLCFSITVYLIVDKLINFSNMYNVIFLAATVE